MAFDRQAQFLGAHADAVILDQEKVGAAIAGGDGDAGGARIHGVLDQFLDGGSRTLDDLALRRCD